VNFRYPLRTIAAKEIKMPFISLSVDPIACLLGVFAIWLAWKAYCASTKHFVKLVRCDAEYLMTGKQSESGTYFKVTLLNLGLPVNQPSVELVFNSDEVYPMAISFNLAPCENHGDTSFAQGMRAAFEFFPISFLSLAKSRIDFKHMKISYPRRQKAAIVVKNAGYEIQRIPLCSQTDWLREKWNSCAYDFDRNFQTTKTDPVLGEILVNHSILQLPKFQITNSTRLRFFSKSWHDEQLRRKAGG